MCNVTGSQVRTPPLGPRTRAKSDKIEDSPALAHTMPPTSRKRRSLPRPNQFVGVLSHHTMPWLVKTVHSRMPPAGLLARTAGLSILQTEKPGRNVLNEWLVNNICNVDLKHWALVAPALQCSLDHVPQAGLVVQPMAIVDASGPKSSNLTTVRPVCQSQYKQAPQSLQEKRTIVGFLMWNRGMVRPPCHRVPRHSQQVEGLAAEDDRKARIAQSNRRLARVSANVAGASGTRSI